MNINNYIPNEADLGRRVLCLYYDAIKWAAENGIVKGYGDSRYDPEATVTRQDLAVIFLRYAKFAEISLPELRDYPDFDDDNAISDYAKEAVEAFYRAEILNGKPDNMFDPQAVRREPNLQRCCAGSLA